ncbi:MAG: hypothetical protein IT304_06170 [Dehalococcoidia bacterium]|nr:hypothetical protein [Dehalococcoidia bacterium]
MALIVVTSSRPGEGKTGVAAAVARRIAYTGRPVRLLRATDDLGNALEDAAWFATLDFVPGSPATTVTADEIRDPGPDSVLVAEAGPAVAAAVPGAVVVLVARGVAPEAPPAGLQPAATVVLAVPAGAARPERSDLIMIPEDRTLAGFSFDDVQRLLSAELLVDGSREPASCDYLVVAPIGSDAGQPYFRRFDTKAVVVRFDKTDMHLAAMQAEPEFLVLTGGRRPSGYLFDAAGARGIPVLLSRTDTENTVIALEGLWDRTRFDGERKLERMAAVLAGTGLDGLLGV